MQVKVEAAVPRIAPNDITFPAQSMLLYINASVTGVSGPSTVNGAIPVITRDTVTLSVLNSTKKKAN